MREWWPVLVVGAALYILLQPKMAATQLGPSWVPPLPGMTPNGDPAIPGVNVPDPWSGNTGGLLTPNPSAGYGFGAYSQ